MSKKLTVGELLKRGGAAPAPTKIAMGTQTTAPRELDYQVTMVDPADLVPWDENPRDNDRAAAKLADEIRDKGFRVPIVATPDGIIRAGHTRHKAAILLGLTQVPVLYQDFASEEEAQAFSISDNRLSEEAKWDKAKLGNILARWEKSHGVGMVERMTGFTQGQVLSLTGQGEEVRHGGLSDDFGVPPFSVLDGRQGYWRGRKQAWIALGIKSELGRDQGATAYPGQDRLNSLRGEVIVSTGISIFDPVLCELVYRWFCPPGGKVLDPFAGGSVRGAVAACLGLEYIGIDISKPQVVANNSQIDGIRRKWDGE